jgi:hypothetical protein
MSNFIESRLSQLKQKSFAELSQLDAYQGEKVKQGGKTFTLSIWKDVVTATEIRIVVQAYRHLFCGIGRITADGFRIDQGGTIYKLSRHEIYDFT